MMLKTQIGRIADIECRSSSGILAAPDRRISSALMT
jgi:hypothetical protein